MHNQLKQEQKIKLLKQIHFLINSTKLLKTQHQQHINTLTDQHHQKLSKLNAQITSKNTQIRRLTFLVSNINDQHFLKIQQLQSLNHQLSSAKQLLKKSQQQIENYKRQIKSLKQQNYQQKQQIIKPQSQQQNKLQTVQQIHNQNSRPHSEKQKEQQIKNNETQKPSIQREEKQQIEQENIQLSQHQLAVHKQFVDFSKIMKSLSQYKKLIGFFGDKSLKFVKLLYQGSSNEFKVEKFHQKCNGHANTLTLIETEYGRVIGGYTGIAWNSNQSWMGDDSKESFIFSLTNGDKFLLKDKNSANSAVCNYPDCGPIFGNGFDLYLCDNANTTKQSFANINYTYINNKYKKDDKLSWLKFSGSQKSSLFLTKQWQVWQVQFQCN